MSRLPGLPAVAGTRMSPAGTDLRGQSGKIRILPRGPFSREFRNRFFIGRTRGRTEAQQMREAEETVGGI